MDSDTYKTIKSASHGIFKDRGSRFISYAYPVHYEEEIKKHIDKIRKENYDASHHCFAYMIGQERMIWRVSDDGEPSGTEGKPILGQINSFGLTNILVVVSRYFGGTLLGVSGLINAYRSAAASAIQNAVIIERTVQEYYEIRYPYDSMNDVMKLLKEEDIGQSEQVFDMECRIMLNFRVLSKEKILRCLSKIDGLKYKFIKTL